MNRRDFLQLLGIGGATAFASSPLFAPVPSDLNDRLDQVCFSLGRWSRKQNVQIRRVIMTDESGRLVLDGKSDKSPRATNSNMFLLSDGSFHLADRNDENYTQVVYYVESRYLMRMKEASVFINGCHRFPLVFGPRDRHA
jgi:hypothetical protein